MNDLQYDRVSYNNLEAGGTGVNLRRLSGLLKSRFTAPRRLESISGFSKAFYLRAKRSANDNMLGGIKTSRFGGLKSLALTIHLDRIRPLTSNGPSNPIRKLSTLIKPALSLGGIETIICSPAQTSHLKMSDDDRAELGITDSLLRLSVGVEDPEDLIADIKNALT